MTTTDPEIERERAAPGLSGLELALAWAAVILLVAVIAFVMGAVITT